VSNRTYLSIGDVLTLLREEFPDVTISKIRFLESQGLVNPERSPSGYRKFFDHDVERLRWVLRQQREHFLPLKVIRDRLADGELDDPTSPAETVNGNMSVPSLSTLGPTADRQTAADDEAMARIIADASRRAALLPDTPTDSRAVHVMAGPGATGAPYDGDGSGGSVDAAMSSATPHASAAPSAAAIRADAHLSRATASAPASSMSGPASRQSTPGDETQGPPPARAASAGSSGLGSDASASPTTPPSTPPASPRMQAPVPPSTTGPAGSPESRPGRASSAVVTGVSMTAAEICAASGLGPEELSALEGYGLLESVSVAGIATYDEEALAIANLAAAFRVFGIEARHLRQYRIAVDREVGLIEQVVIPLLRQRNPEARQRALDGSEQMAVLGESMRAALLRVALRHHLRG
jgi:DNA-binding transcriptional MerR regulator